MRSLLSALALLVLCLNTACLPSSQRQKTQAMTPADSLSRQIAAEAPVDTLRLAWMLEAPAATPFEFPTSLVWRPDSLGGDLVVADTRRESLHRVSAAGVYLGEARPEGLAYPYLAGQREDTLVVFSRGANRLDFVAGDSVVRQVALPEGGFSAAIATNDALWAKRTDEGDAFLARLNGDGRMVARYPLGGEHWRHFGFLRPWGDSLLSLSGYRPAVDALPSEAANGTTADSLALLGFDSPQLVRAYQFILGEVDEPPLLSSSAAALGDRLFVLNLRVDLIRLDVFRRTPGGLRIERALVYPDPEGLADAFPADLAVRRDAEGYHFAILLQRPGGVLSRPGGHLRMLRWSEPAAPAAVTP